MNSRVVVGMSGGVDSSVAAALLQEQGYEVIGIMLRLWSEKGSNRENRCCSSLSIDDARGVAIKLNIPFYVLDYSKIFKTTIVDNFLHDYSIGITPNPCFSCNLNIRFGHLLKEALNYDARYLATGHYALLEKMDNDKFSLKVAIDEKKDQSYMLHRLSQFELSHALFPLGKYRKPEIRKLAKFYGFDISDKKDSQDLCFLGDDGHKGFVKRHLAKFHRPGPIKNLAGDVLGEHSGLPQYTIGQRKGFSISSNVAHYVVKINSDTNELIVAEDQQRGHRFLTAHNFNFTYFTPQNLPFDCKVKLRYHSPFYEAKIVSIKDDLVDIELKDPVKDITPGQGAVVYVNDNLLGGGTISKIED
ncbi:MAG: tRNA 2-thiouridine(34) synthase MnmA [SAR324 cluster bacterium]|nr:tRNA 2-thiouridine(34) synthase MnmA [SAR324 cluster bacterium]